ncbi:hypothetical protein SLEP1_g32861 [Rubroshorea leprosula]|uniref:Retrovirus-related Pol polyprotein from transposon TNT 1-94 n=1 Tax=Rubroshorea leprosula TaxID=152421 RepID=A0AAV5KEU3_9ROSI|nr:hypothetical protein SLEP1_g32861 [Rubroshorea leprosula]
MEQAKCQNGLRDISYLFSSSGLVESVQPIGSSQAQKHWEFHEPIFSKQKSDNMKDEEWRLLHRRVCGFIRQWIDDSVLNHINNETSACTLWTKLDELFRAKTGQNKLCYIKQLMYSRYKDGTPTVDHINNFLGIIKELANLGIEFDDEVNGLILLNTLPESWESFRSTMINSSPSGKVTLEIAKNRIFKEEKRMRALRIFSQSDTQAPVMKNRSRSKTREPKGRGGKDKKKVEDSNNTAVASTSGSDVTLLCDCGECCHAENTDAKWIIDFDAFYHCVPKREYFSTYKAGDCGTIKMGNKSVSHIMRVGDICVQTNVRCTLTLKNGRHIPDMHMNLLFAKALDEKGYAHYFGSGNWKLTKGSLVVAKGGACCSLYKTHMKTCGGQLNTVEDEGSPNLWHKRLAYMSKKGLQLLAKQSFIPTTKGEHVNPCDVCLFGKQHQVSFQKNLTRKENKLDLVYSNVYGPWRLWDPEKKKTVKSKNVVFHEHEKINDLKEEKAIRSSGEGVEDLPPEKPPSRKITNEEEMQVPEDETKEPIIEKDEAMVKMSSIRVVLGLTTSMNLELKQLDVKTAFLHGDLYEEIYMDQPEGFKEEGNEHMVCKLKKSLYGLKQAPRQSLKEELSKSFDMKDLGPTKQILGMAITHDRKAGKLWLSHEKYVEWMLERFNMKHAKPVSTPLANHFKLSKQSCPNTKEEKEKMSSIHYSSTVGSLMYAMVCTRPDISHAIGVVSRFLSNLGKIHWEAVKWIFRYLRRTTKLCLTFGQTKPILKGYTDADMAGDLDNRKFISGYLFTFAGGAVSWQSKLQKCVALSTTEAEYIAATEAGTEMLWMKRFLQELGLK